ncbi:MAG: cytochrome c4 [Immundisolibacteraceae bacterium]|nr:cytochrome c4 [Immundisolibacteraceae bacterium]
MAIFRAGGRNGVIWAAGLLAAMLMNVSVASEDQHGAMAGDVAAGKSKSTICAACHSADGNSVVSIWPKLAGQKVNYLQTQIKAFRDGDRKDPSMQPMVANLSDQDIADLAAYFASQQVSSVDADPAQVQLGALIYRGGNSETKVPACMSCHGPEGLGNNQAGWPSLNGQHADYVEKQLKAYASGSRSSDPKSMMRDVSSRLSEQEIKAVAQFVTGLQ